MLYLHHLVILSLLAIDRHIRIMFYKNSLQITFRIYCSKNKSDMMFYGLTLVLTNDYTNDKIYV